jgi:hypothetical protein
VPRIIGHAVKVPALITVIAVLIGGALLGIVGALVATRAALTHPRNSLSPSRRGLIAPFPEPAGSHVRRESEITSPLVDFSGHGS